MAIRGQRFELDLDADDFVANPIADNDDDVSAYSDMVKDIKEHELTTATDVPPAPRKIHSKTGFPDHRPRKNTSKFKKRQQSADTDLNLQTRPFVEPSDRAIIHQAAKNGGYDLEAKQKAEIGQENNQKIAAMSISEIEKARAELMSSLSPGFIERLLRKANIDDDQNIHVPMTAETSTLTDDTSQESHSNRSTEHRENIQTSKKAELANTLPPASSIHFPVPPRNPDDFVPLDPSSSTFLTDLQTHYFPDIPHDTSSLSWLQDPTAEEDEDSSYNPEKTSYAPSSLRFGFKGQLIPPKESLKINVDEGLHHHGEAPSSAGYTIPELALLSRSVLPNQRCVAYRTLGRILYRLGRGGFGPRGSELQEGLWKLWESERILEIIMAEANRENGPVSARAYATEALWLWRKGGGSDRGILQPTERLAK